MIRATIFIIFIQHLFYMDAICCKLKIKKIEIVSFVRGQSRNQCYYYIIHYFDIALKHNTWNVVTSNACQYCSIKTMLILF